MILTSSQRSAAAQAASRLGVPVEWLLAIISFESGGNPKAKNPKSSARGLIQFIDSTAKSLGYSGSLDLVNRHPTFESQVTGPVVAYFSNYKPFPTRESFLGTVFYPKYRNSPDTLLPAVARAANPGFNTLRDYTNRVWSRWTGIKLVEGGSGTLVLVLVGWGLWRAWKGKPLLPRLR